MTRAPLFPCHSISDGRCSCGDADCDSPGKHPLTPRGFKDASRDRAQLAVWAQRWPDHNRAMPTGAVSGYDVLDIDAGRDGEETLSRLGAEHEPLPDTWVIRTGGGGYHIYFTHAPGLGNSADRIGPGIDVRADGGYVMVPPSTHISGRRYDWLNKPGDPHIALAPWPRWLLERAMGPTQTTARIPIDTLPRSQQRVADGLVRYAQAGADQGERDRKGFWLACRLIEEYGPTLDSLAVLTLFGHSCRPPMSDRDVDRIWRSAPRYTSAAQGVAR